jgi:hypothetical protein
MSGEVIYKILMIIYAFFGGIYILYGLICLIHEQGVHNRKILVNQVDLNRIVSAHITFKKCLEDEFLEFVLLL